MAYPDPNQTCTAALTLSGFDPRVRRDLGKHIVPIQRRLSTGGTNPFSGGKE
jgi:hypothetical protein